MDFQSIFRWESLPEAGFGKTLLLMLIDVAVTAFSWIILTRGGPLFKTTDDSADVSVQTTVQTTVSNACISHALASAARAASLCAGHAQQLGGESPPPT